MSMEVAHLEAFIERLEHMRKRPHMYVEEISDRAITNFLFGFHTACELLGFAEVEQLFQCLFWEVCEERGWEINSFGPQKRMRDSGWSEEAIVEELIVIEIETWRRIVGMIEYDTQRSSLPSLP